MTPRLLFRPRVSRAHVAAALAALLLLLPSCVQVPMQRRLIEIRRYAIDPEISKERADSVLAFSLLVRPFQGSGSQGTDRMLYSDEEHGMDFYFYNRWTVVPEKMVEDALVHDLMNWGLFGGGVYQGDAGIIPTHELQGRLVKLYADNGEGQPSAVFDAAISVLRVDPQTYRREVVLQQDLPVTVGRRNREIGSFVEATNEAVRIWLELVRSELDALFRREAKGAAHPPASGVSARVQPLASSPAVAAPSDFGSSAPPDSGNPALPDSVKLVLPDSTGPAGVRPDSTLFPPAPTPEQGGAASP
jgi:ABC-type uncharacterized transport system auxiliary subunit